MATEALDFNDFMRRVQNDKELFLELLDIFLDDYRLKREALDDAMGKKDKKLIEQIAHFLKGSCGNISAVSLRDIFGDLESRAKGNDMTDLERYLPDIDEKFEALLQQIEELRVKLS